MNLLSKCALGLLLVSATIFTVSAQGTIIPLDEGISLLGHSKRDFFQIIQRLQYNFDNRSGNIFGYKKIVNGYKFRISVVFNNSNIEAFGWTEGADNLFTYIADLKLNRGFTLYNNFNSDGIIAETYYNDQQNLMVTTIYKQVDDPQHFIINIGRIKKERASTKNTAQPIIRDIQNVSQLPDLRKLNHSKVITFKTTLSNKTITDHYKNIAQKTSTDDLFYVASSAKSNDACISVQIKNQGNYNLIIVGWECD